MAQLHVERDAGGVVTCWIDNPQRRNALTDAMLATLAGVLREATVANGTRAVLMRGRGATFCSGRDLRELEATGDESDAALAARIAPVQRLALALRSCQVPTIAVVEGKAAGLGVALASWCDLVLAHAGATFSIPEARAGVTPSFTAISLVRAIGRAAALDLCLTGRTVGATEAAALGLVQRLSDAGQLEEDSRALLDSLCAGSPQALSACKALLATTAGLGFEEALTHAASAAVGSMRSSDAAEGMQAFREKRQPGWALPREGSQSWPAHA